MTILSDNHRIALQASIDRRNAQIALIRRNARVLTSQEQRIVESLIHDAVLRQSLADLITLTYLVEEVALERIA